MIDPKLEKQINYVEKYQALWNQFYEQFNAALEREDVTPEAERNFLNLKGRIAFATQTMNHLLGDKFDFRKDVIKVLRFPVTIAILQEESPVRVNNFRGNWHHVFIQLNTLHGSLKTEREEMSNVSPAQHKFKQLAQSPGFKMAIVLVVILILLGIIGVAVLMNLDAIMGLFGGE